MSDLLDRMRNERKFSHELNGIMFEIELPTINYILLNLETDVNKIDFVRQQVTGWKEAKESHFIEDGDPKVDVAFHPEVFNEYIVDRPLVANALFHEIVNKATERSTRLNALGKP
jgi:hypothetical protein